jgi:RNA polymerase subunit RPABC4/transcription elongation factor Spt4
MDPDPERRRKESMIRDFLSRWGRVAAPPRGICRACGSKLLSEDQPCPVCGIPPEAGAPALPPPPPAAPESVPPAEAPPAEAPAPVPPAEAPPAVPPPEVEPPEEPAAADRAADGAPPGLPPPPSPVNAFLAGAGGVARCSTCGSEVLPEATLCPACGSRFGPLPPTGPS